MAGHYADPIAKVKVETGNTVNVASSDTRKVVSTGITVKNEDANTSESYTVVGQKSDNSRAVTPGQSSKHSLHNLTNKAVVAVIGNKNANTIEQSSAIYYSPNSLEKIAGDGGGHHHYLGAFFLCLLLGLIFLLLAAVSVVGGSAAGLGLFAILAYVMWIAALVFLILWIVSLVS